MKKLLLILGLALACATSGVSGPVFRLLMAQPPPASGGGGSGQSSMDFQFSTNSSTGASSYLFTVLVGPESADRKVLLLPANRDTGDDTLITSISLSNSASGLVAASLVTMTNSPNTAVNRVEAWIASFPSGTSADLRYTYSEPTLRTICDVYSGTNVSSTIGITGDTNAAGALVLSTTGVTGGVIVSVEVSVRTSGGVTWTGSNENSDTGLSSLGLSSASTNAVGFQVITTITTGAAEASGLSLVFQP